MTEAVKDESLDEFLGTPPGAKGRKWLIGGGILLVVLIVVLVGMRALRGGETPNYTTRAADKGDLTVTVSATGNLKPINQVDVGSEQSGLLTHVFVDVNDRVKKGQVVAEIDPARLVDTVNQSKAQLASAEANLAQAQAQAALSRATLARQEDVFKLSGGKVPSATELDSARANASAGEASVAQAKAQIGVSRAQLSTAVTNLNKTKILSPVDGVVLTRNVQPGQTVASGLNVATLFTIAEDLTRMEVQVSVDEADVGQVKSGQPASFTVDAFPGRSFPARITRVNVGANGFSAASSSSTASTTTSNSVVAYTAVLSVSNPDELLLPGMTASADITTKRLNGVLLVPNAALRFTPKTAGRAGFTLGGPVGRSAPAAKTTTYGAGSSQTVYIIGADGKPKPVSIVIGDSDGTRTVVTGGDLKAGMKVITAQLAAGQTAPPDAGGGNGG